MNWTDDINLIVGTLRDLAAHSNDATVRDILTEGIPELSVNHYGNWNGGTTHFTLSVSVPPHVFVQVEPRLEMLEAKILSWVKSLTRAETHNFIDTVVVQPGVSSVQRVVPAMETPFWIPGHFRLFISHLSIDKVRAANLSGALKSFAISSFVAHEDIEPTKEWNVEIEKALFSMDALAAILTEQFHESKWTDQEVGVALGRGVAVLPIRAGLDPYGLLGKYQGIPAVDRSLREVARSIIATLLNNSKTRHRIVQCLVEQLLAAPSEKQAALQLEALEQAHGFAEEQLIRIRDNAASNPVLFDHPETRNRVNALLAKNRIAPIHAKVTTDELTNDEIPF